MMFICNNLFKANMLFSVVFASKFNDQQLPHFFVTLGDMFCGIISGLTCFSYRSSMYSWQAYLISLCRLLLWRSQKT